MFVVRPAAGISRLGQACSKLSVKYSFVIFRYLKEKLKANLRRITIKQLRALATVVESGTISAAARRLNLTPPAVSLQLRALEEAAGMPLLERGHDRLRLTDAGREVLETAKRIEFAFAECEEALAVLDGADRGRVSVGVVSTAKYFAPMVLAAFQKAHPKVEVRLQVGNRETTLTALREFELDFAITGRPPNEFEVERAVIGDHPHIIIGPPDHPLAARRRLALADLADETFLLREQGSGTRLLMQRLFSEAGLNPHLGMEIGSNETIKQAVMAGLGIALISAHTAAAELKYGRLIAFPITGLPVIRQWFAIKMTDKRLMPAARALWDYFATSGANFLPDGSGLWQMPRRAS